MSKNMKDSTACYIIETKGGKFIDMRHEIVRNEISFRNPHTMDIAKDLNVNCH